MQNPTLISRSQLSRIDRYNTDKALAEIRSCEFALNNFTYHPSHFPKNIVKRDESGNITLQGAVFGTIAVATIVGLFAFGAAHGWFDYDDVKCEKGREHVDYDGFKICKVSEKFVVFAKDALKVLKEKAPDDYGFAKKYANVIDAKKCISESGEKRIACAGMDGKHIYFNYDPKNEDKVSLTPSKEGAVFEASIIGHEGRHNAGDETECEPVIYELEIALKLDDEFRELAEKEGNIPSKEWIEYVKQECGDRWPKVLEKYPLVKRLSARYL